MCLSIDFFFKLGLIHKIQNYTAIRQWSASICPDNGSCQRSITNQRKQVME